MILEKVTHKLRVGAGPWIDVSVVTNHVCDSEIDTRIRALGITDVESAVHYLNYYKLKKEVPVTDYLVIGFEWYSKESGT